MSTTTQPTGGYYTVFSLAPDDGDEWQEELTTTRDGDYDFDLACREADEIVHGVEDGWLARVDWADANDYEDSVYSA